MPGRSRHPTAGPLVLAAMAFQWVASAAHAQQPTIRPDGSIHVPAFALPQSSLVTAASSDVLKAERAQKNKESALPDACVAPKSGAAASPEAQFQCEIAAFYRTAEYRHLRQLYPVTLSHKVIAGVYTEIFEPADGIAPENASRVLINVHGGGFESGARTESHTESVPIASVGKIRVISIDYREAPEAVFPAASEDVAKVYAELLKTYRPANIGLYGCSAGGLLTAESIAWFQKLKLPLPGAVGMLCAGATFWTEGDSGVISKATGWWPFPDEAIDNSPYFKGVRPDDPLAFPGRSPQIMSRFPPSLLIAGTRDVALSSVAFTHATLVAHGVPAELHVWEGMGHAFFFNPDLAESREVYAVVTQFFDAHLAR